MSADRLHGLAALLDRFERGAETADERATIRRALLAAADGRPVAEILKGGARNKRDDALNKMRAEHFAGMAPSRAAKEMAQCLARCAVSAPWRAKEEPPRGGLQRACFDVLSFAYGAPPSWRTILRALPSQPLSLAKASGRQGQHHG